MTFRLTEKFNISTEFPHSASPEVNIFHNQSAAVEARKPTAARRFAEKRPPVDLTSFLQEALSGTFQHSIPDRTLRFGVVFSLLQSMAILQCFLI